MEIITIMSIAAAVAARAAISDGLHFVLPGGEAINLTREAAAAIPTYSLALERTGTSAPIIFWRYQMWESSPEEVAAIHVPDGLGGIMAADRSMNGISVVVYEGFSQALLTTIDLSSGASASTEFAFPSDWDSPVSQIAHRWSVNYPNRMLMSSEGVTKKLKINPDGTVSYDGAIEKWMVRAAAGVMLPVPPPESAVGTPTSGTGRNVATFGPAPVIPRIPALLKNVYGWPTQFAFTPAVLPQASPVQAGNLSPGTSSPTALLPSVALSSPSPRDVSSTNSPALELKWRSSRPLSLGLLMLCFVTGLFIRRRKKRPGA